MFLLMASILIFVVVIGLIIMANWPASSSVAPLQGMGCGCGGRGCGNCGCRGCGMPRPRCGCGSQGGQCSFC